MGSLRLETLGSGNFAGWVTITNVLKFSTCLSKGQPQSSPRRRVLRDDATAVSGGVTWICVRVEWLFVVRRTRVYISSL